MSFRTVLRENTRSEHDNLDAMLTTLNINERDGFARFIQIHLTCFQTMHEVAQSGSYARQLLNQMVQCLVLDLDTIGGAPAPISAPFGAEPDPLAMDYIVSGSRLGSRVLKTRWGNAHDPIVRRANAYFNLETDASFWPTTCSALAAIAPDSARAAQITRDTGNLFDLFSRAYRTTKKREAVAQ